MWGKRLIVWVAAILVAGGAGWLLGVARAAPPAPPVTPPSALAANPDLDPGTRLSGPAPGFTLENQFGQPVSLREYRGRVVVLAFVDSECTTVCPLTTTSMVNAVEMLPPADRTRVALLGIDANPTATAVQDVYAYSATHGILHQWNFLTGSLSALKKVWKAYGIEVAVIHGLIDHTPALYVINAEGRERDVYLTQMSYAAVEQQAEVLADEVARLLPGHPAVHAHLSFRVIQGEGPAARVTLPPIAGLPGPAATLGPGHPRLVVFLASWLRETVDMKAFFSTLGAYAVASRASGLPPLVAVDESVTEPSARALAAVMRAAGVVPSYPVVADTSGRVADGYGAQGMPTYVLLNAAGRVLWQDGNPITEPRVLLRDVRAALARRR